MNKQELIDELKKEIEVIRNNADWEDRVETYEKGKRIGLEFGWMLAEKLDEPEITEEQAWNKIAESYPADVRSLVTSFQNFYYGDFIKNPTNSKKETVEVPKFVADWIDGIKTREVQAVATGEEDLIFEICQQFYEETLTEQLREWFESNINSYVFYNAVLRGYTIEPPKTLQLIVKNYDSTVYKTELPEDEAMKLIEGWKGNE